MHRKRVVSVAAQAGRCPFSPKASATASTASPAPVSSALPLPPGPAAGIDETAEFAKGTMKYGVERHVKYGSNGARRSAGQRRERNQGVLTAKPPCSGRPR